jgi:hypothetical protein
VDIFLQAHREAPEEIILDLDATDDPLHGKQEGRFSMATGQCPNQNQPDTSRLCGIANRLDSRVYNFPGVHVHFDLVADCKLSS